MGSGASQSGAAQMEEMLATSMFLGAAISEMSFPGIHGLKEFNMDPAARTTAASTSASDSMEGSRAQSNAANDGDNDGDDDNRSGSTGPPPLIDPELEAKYFTVFMYGEAIYLDPDVTKCNEDGWNPLHACCHSNCTAAPGLTILKKFIERGGDVNMKTRRGPGAFNSGWSALHISAGYGVLPLVEALIEAGADVNCVNDVAWTPLLEACHRGFTGIVKVLVKAGADIHHAPGEEASKKAHFMRGPPQSPLGEAARCGHVEICKFLIDMGADKNQSNSLGWTPLHEACFYNNSQVVEMLLVHGTDAKLRNQQGAMPYHLASMPKIREAIEEIAGKEAAKPLQVPTFVLRMDENGQIFIGIKPATPDEDERDGQPQPKSSKVKSSHANSSRSPHSPSHNSAKEEEVKPLHQGSVLGELPALGKPKVTPLLGEDLEGLGPRWHDGSTGAPPTTRKAEGKKQNKDKSKGERERRSSSSSSGGDGKEREFKCPLIPEGTPLEFICQLSKRVMREPVLTPYGSVYEKEIIQLWLKKQGSIDPLTGSPLVESQLIEAKDIKRKMREWDLKEIAKNNTSLTPTVQGSSDGVSTNGEHEAGKSHGGAHAAKGNAESKWADDPAEGIADEDADIYDF